MLWYFHPVLRRNNTPPPYSPPASHFTSSTPHSLPPPHSLLPVIPVVPLPLVTVAKYTEHATPSYVKLNFLKLTDLFRHEIAKLMHKILRNNHPPNFSDFFFKQKTFTIEKHVFLQTNMQ